MHSLQQRVEQAQRQIADLKNHTARKDLTRMVQPVAAVLIKLDQESVECRRLHRHTARYQELTKQAEQLVDHLEKYLLFACLLRG